jgi:acetolactate synthase-1/3 small subunit
MIQPISFLVWTENSPGVLLRLTTLFTRRKVNIESLTVSATEREGISRFTIVVQLDHVLAATVGRQIERMVDVTRVFVFADSELIHREVALFRAALSEEREREVLARYPDASVIQRGREGTLLQVSGTEALISSLLDELRNESVSEFVRSGRVAVSMTGDYQADLSRSIHELRPGASEGPDV